MALDKAGDLYVGDTDNNRVDKFDPSGRFVEAWGWGVVNGAEELQKCTTSCQQGNFGSGAGQLNQPLGVAVDSSSGDVYVVDNGRHRVQKFTSNGEFVLMFGGHVNKKTNGDVCTKVEATQCQEGTEGVAAGEFAEWPFGYSFIAVGPGGSVYVGDLARVQVFDSSGNRKESISLAGLSLTGTVTALAVDASGDVFVKIGGNPASEVAGVREFGPPPGRFENPMPFDLGSESVEDLTVDGSGNVFVGDSAGGFHVLKYSAAGEQLDSFGSNTVLGQRGSRGMTFSEALPGEPKLYASDSEVEDSSVVVLPVPPLGPSIDGESATPGPKVSVTLAALINPQTEQHTTSLIFQYVTEAEFKKQVGGKTCEWACATSTPPFTLLHLEFNDQSVSAEVTGLLTSTVYRYRVLASNECEPGKTCTATGTGQSFETLSFAQLDAVYSTDVGATSATFDAQINPLGTSTEYRLEYGASTSYGTMVGGNVGEGVSDVLAAVHRQGLQPGTTYHYRFSVHNALGGTIEGVDHTLTTQPVSASELALTDGRAWELVSPADKKGGVIQPFREDTQASRSGGAITYPVLGAVMGEGVVGNNTISFKQVLSKRGSEGWQHQPANPEGSGGSQDISLPRSEPRAGEPIEVFSGGAYRWFTQDLGRAEAFSGPDTTLSPETLAGTEYLRDDTNGSWTALLTPTNTPPGTKLLSGVGKLESEMRSLDRTPDLSHVILGSPLKLTAEAIPAGYPISYAYGNLYEWSAGQLALVDILPGKPGVPLHEELSAELAGSGTAEAGTVQRAVSDDGRWVAWTRGNPYIPAGIQFAKYKGLYVRDMVGERTVQVGGPHALYQTMSSDGSHVFFLEDGELYVLDPATGVQRNLTVGHGAGEASAGVQELISDVSEDGSYVYFVAQAILANGGVSGEDNLYLSHEENGGWSIRYIATLSNEDEKTWSGRTGFGIPALDRLSSRVSPGGRYFAFMSQRSLTGYDNIDANSGRPDEEVFLYDARSGHLVCASCNPTGARPVGVEDKGLVADTGIWGSHWLAGGLPGWQVNIDGAYQPRYLSDSGRLFFNSPDALVPQDTNGLEDVYEYEPIRNAETAASDGCSTASPTFSERSGGCVNLISSGTSSAESAFLDASETGDDVFFITSARLTPADVDTSYDVYDAHVCSASSPCFSIPASTPACSSGDSCKAASSPQPEIFGPGASETFSGAGNVSGSPSQPVVGPRALTRAQKLARALRACHKTRDKRKRASCERNAHKLYGARQARNTNAIKRSGK